jgi:GntR family transcriptional regulator
MSGRAGRRGGRAVIDRSVFLSAPLPRDPGVPLRVKVHSRILDAIRGGVLTPGSMIPTEAELGRLMGVSRTVVREALMLLDEDGFVVSRRGIGRFVADALPRIGLERIRPIEELLSTADGRVGLRRSEATLQQVSATFVTEGLGLSAQTPTWFFETVIERGGEAVALTQEHFSAAGIAGSEDAEPIVARMTGEAPGPVTTLLSLLLERFGPGVAPGVVRLTVGVLGPARSALLDADPAEPALILTQTADIKGLPSYLAKHMLLGRAGQLSVMQSGQ